MLRRLNGILKLGTVVLAGVSIAACARYPANEPVTRLDPEDGYRFTALDPGENTESLFVIVTFSGGGTRAAALSYGVMEKLRDTRIRWKGKEKRLLDEVDVISSVSGGSFTAAYYGLFRDRLFAKTDGFEARFLYRDLQGELTGMLFNPVNWLRLASPTFGRIDLAAELYDETIFEGKRFAAMRAMGRPFVMINATDMSKGAPFSFVQSQFDLICSDLTKYSVARAVAASSNFPVAFTPLQVDNHANACEFEKPRWIDLAAKDRDFAINPRRNNRARIAWSYRDAIKRPYLHLLDGGVADNIGLRGPLTALTSNNHPWSVLNRINSRVIEKLVVIIVDAKTRPDSDYDQDASPPGLIDVLTTTATVPLDNYSFDTVERLNIEFDQWRKARGSLWTEPKHTFMHCPPPPDKSTPRSLQPLDLYAVYVGFDQIADGETIFGRDRNWYLNLPTSFVLPADRIDKLRGVGQKLMEKSPAFRDLARCLQ